MEKKNLSEILEGKVFYIPDYRKGYAREVKQWKDFVQDIDAMVDGNISSLYTGMIVIYQPDDKSTQYYGTRRLEGVLVIDGQQRLVTCSLYLSIILNELIKIGKEDYSADIQNFLYSGSKSKIRFNKDIQNCYLGIISKGVCNIEENSVEQKRICAAYSFLKKHMEEQLTIRKEKAEDYLKDLFDAIIRKLKFSFYSGEDESESEMIFELISSRGKDHSYMESLESYLMYWVHRNTPYEINRFDLMDTFRRIWRKVYVNISKCDGSEDQCLRIAWTLLVNHIPKNWDGYNGFTSDDVIPLINFSMKSIDEVEDFLVEFMYGLLLISEHYSAIIKPNNNLSDERESEFLATIAKVGIIDTFLPLLVASRIKREEKEVSDDDYYGLLESIEEFLHRMFLKENKISNEDISRFYSWADDVFNSRLTLKSVINRI